MSAYRRILVLMDNRLDSNWGSRATTNALFNLLRQSHPEAEIRGVPRSAARPRRALARRICEAVAPEAALAGNWRGWLRSRVLRWLTEKMRSDLEWADLVIVNGEGTLHPQKQCMRWMPVIAALPMFTKAPLWVVNCTIQVCGSKWEDLWKTALAMAERIVVREPASFREVQRLGLHVEQGADCAFAANFIAPEKAQEIIKSRGISKPFAVLTGGALADGWPTAPQRAILSMLKDQGLEVVYVTSTQEDSANYERVGMDCKLITEKDADYPEIMGIIREASQLIGGRFHPIVFAVCGGTPFVCFSSNTHKMAGLLEMLGTQYRLLDIADTRNLWKAIETALGAGDGERRAMETLSRRLADMARLNAAR
ncbi:MAG: polysaccharide pyruvyl transferase family protein [Candidatus Methanosuratincola sp.]